MLLHHCFKTIATIVHVHQTQIAVVTDTSKFKISLWSQQNTISTNGNKNYLCCSGYGRNVV